MSRRAPVRRPALQGDYVLRLRAFLAFTDGELDLLALTEGFAAFTYDIAEVNEDITLVITRDEPITFFVIEPLYGSDNCI